MNDYDLEENEKGTFSETRAETVRTVVVVAALVVNTITCVFAILYYTGVIGSN